MYYIKFASPDFHKLNTAWTHGGNFHADDVFSGAMLRSLNKDLKFIRSRDPNSAKLSDIAFDVGLGEYDHHGPRFGRDSNSVPWCGATRLWEAGLKDALFPDKSDKEAQEIFYRDILTPIALQDNGKKLPGEVPNIFSWVPHMNPRRSYGITSDEAYENSVEIAQKMLPSLIAEAKAKLATKRFLSKLPNNKDILDIPSGLTGWADYLRDNTSTKFVIYPGNNDTPWYAQCVPKKNSSIYSKQVPFPSEWWGADAKKMKDVAGIPDGVFCHADGFLSGYKSRASAILACRKALERLDKKR